MSDWGRDLSRTGFVVTTVPAVGEVNTDLDLSAQTEHPQGSGIYACYECNARVAIPYRMVSGKCPECDCSFFREPGNECAGVRWFGLEDEPLPRYVRGHLGKLGQEIAALRTTAAQRARDSAHLKMESSVAAIMLSIAYDEVIGWRHADYSPVLGGRQWTRDERMVWLLEKLEMVMSDITKSQKGTAPIDMLKYADLMGARQPSPFYTYPDGGGSATPGLGGVKP